MEKIKLNLAYVIGISVLVLILGFLGGMQYQKSQLVKNNQGMFIGNTQNMRNFSGNNTGVRTQRTSSMTGNFNSTMPKNNNGLIIGEISSVDDNTITIKTKDGSSKIIIYSTNTNINKSTQGEKEDLKTGVNINVFGKSESNGTVSANNIQIITDSQK